MRRFFAHFIVLGSRCTTIKKTSYKPGYDNENCNYPLKIFPENASENTAQLTNL